MMLQQKHINSIIEHELSSIDGKMESIRRYFDMGLMPESEILERSVEIAENAEISLARTLQRLCTEENMAWDQGEWDCLRNTILEHCRLKTVPCEYHPADLGFDELTVSFFISRGGLDRLDEMYAHPDPIGKTFLLKLQLKNKDSFVWVDYRFEVTDVSDVCDDNRSYKKYKGIGMFPGYCGEAAIEITETDDRLLPVLYQKVYPVPDDPVWQRKKEETVTGYRYITVIPDT